MLRLSPTQIRLEARDLSWHINRHHERQTLRANVPQADLPYTPGKSHTDSPSLGHTSQLFSPPVLFRRPESENGSDVPLISSEPVPQGSKAFWDRILAEAGTPTRTKTISHGNGRVVRRSDDWLESHRSSKASPDSSYNDSPDKTEHHVDEYADELESERLEDDHDAHEIEPKTSTDSFFSTQAMRTSSGNAVPRSALSEVGRTSTRSRLSSLFHRPHHGDLDGPSDSYQEPSGTHLGIATSLDGESLEDGLYGNQRDRRTISSNLESYVDESNDAPVSRGAPRANEQISLPPSPLPVSGPIELSVRRSSALPGSRLRISQAAGSSSPERQPRQVFAHDPTGLLAQPPRRCNNITYRPRSESYSFAASEESYRSALPLPHVDGSPVSPIAVRSLPSLRVSNTNAQTRNFVADRSVSAPQTGPLYDGPPSSPPELPQSAEYMVSLHDAISEVEDPSDRIVSHRGLVGIDSSPSLVNSHSSSPSHRNLSPLAAEFIPSSRRRNISPQLPRYPFSATPRNVSFNLALPSSTSPPNMVQTPPAPPAFFPTSPVLPNPPLTPNRSYPPANFTIYNDRLPPTTQPQTPMDISRSGNIPAAAGSAAQNPFNTVPARVPTMGFGQLNREARLGVATPTRGPSTRTAEINQRAENEGRVSEEERRVRRARLAGMRAEDRERVRQGVGDMDRR